jgi:hypothetical protein
MKKSKIGVAIGLSVALSALLSINTAHAENQLRMAFTSPDEDIEITNPLFFSDISADEQVEYDGEWLKFLKLKTGLDIPSIDDLNYSNIALSLGTQSLNNTLLPSGPLNIQTPYAINLEHNSLTDLDFLRTTTALRNSVYFNDNNLNDVNGLLDLDEALGGLYLQRNQLQQVLGLRKLTHVAQDLDLSENPELATLEGMGSLARVGQALNLSKNPALVDLTGISDLNTVGGAIYLDNVAQYTATPTAESTFCQSILSGNISIEEPDASTVHFGELCSNVEPWIAFLHGHEQLTSLGSLSQWTTENVSLYYKGLTDEDIPSTPMLTDTIYSLDLRFNRMSHVDFLSNIKTIKGRVDLRLSRLENINGLSSLETVKSLYFDGNNSLTNVDGLSSLTNIERILAITYNDSLINLDGLSSLVNVQAMRIQENHSLNNVKGLSSLTSANYLFINGNDSLISVDGLSSLTNSYLFSMSGNDSLTNVNGLSSLTSVRSLYIQDHDSLTNVDGLSSLAEITWLEINGNSVLKNVNGLSSLTSIVRILLHDNPLLTDISGLSNLSSTDSYHGLYIDNPSQYTVTPAIGTPFCEGLKSGSIRVKLVDETVIDYSALCY